MTTRAKHWLCGLGLFVYGSVIHLLLFRLFVRWVYPRNQGIGPLWTTAIVLLGGAFVALLMFPLLRRSRTGNFLIIIKASALGLAATLLALQTLFLLASSFLALQSMRVDYHDGWTFPEALLLSIVEIETYGLVVMFQSIPFALGQGVLGGALVVWLRKFFQLSQAC
jgi:hypothetical protein